MPPYDANSNGTQEISCRLVRERNYKITYQAPNGHSPSFMVDTQRGLIIIIGTKDPDTIERFLFNADTMYVEGVETIER